MKLADQCCTLEQAKRLKGLGVLQDTYASWFGDENHTIFDQGNSETGMRVSKYVYVDTTVPYNSLEEDHRADIGKTRPIAAAYNVAELGVMLGVPCNLVSQVYVGYSSEETEWVGDFDGNKKYRQTHNREAVARAAILIHAIEENLVPVTTVNQRLTKIN